MLKRLTAKIDGKNMSTDEIIEAVLEERGIEDLSEWLHPSEDCLISFDKMKGLPEAYELIDEGIAMGERFLILSDPDVDGCSSSGILYRYLKRCGADVNVTINIGKKHGAEGFDLSLLKDVDIMIIVDSLNNDPNVYKNIVETGVKLCVMDHHLPTEELLNSDIDFILISSAVDYPNNALSGAGVVLKYCLYADEMNLTNYCDDLWVYAAMGIVSDMSSMAVPENRFIVSKGLSQYNNPIVKKMVGSYMFNSELISFSIAPLVNSGVRMKQNEIAMQTFMTDDEDELDTFVKQLKKCKEAQNKIVDSMIDDLIKQGERQSDRKCLIFMVDTDEGELLGLMGNRLLSIFSKPLIIIRDNDGQYMGSMRSVGVNNFLQMVNDTGYATCSGHESAAGFFCDKDKFEDFKIAIEDELKDIEFCCECTADVEITPDQVNDQLIKTFNTLNRISGTGCPPVTVLMKTDNYTVDTFTNKKHLKIIDGETGVLLVKWNDASWKTMKSDKTFVGIGTLSNPYYGRNKFYQLTLNEYAQFQGD